MMHERSSINPLNFTPQSHRKRDQKSQNTYNHHDKYLTEHCKQVAKLQLIHQLIQKLTSTTSAQNHFCNSFWYVVPSASRKHAQYFKYFSFVHSQLVSLPLTVADKWSFTPLKKHIILCHLTMVKGKVGHCTQCIVRSWSCETSRRKLLKNRHQSKCMCRWIKAPFCAAAMKPHPHRPVAVSGGFRFSSLNRPNYRHGEVYST